MFRYIKVYSCQLSVLSTDFCEILSVVSLKPDKG